MGENVLQTAGVVLVCGDAPRRVLLLRAYRHWDFPKGMPEVGETLLQAALREMHEETGLNAEAVRQPWGICQIQTAAYRTSHEGRSRQKVGHFFLLESVLPQPAVTLSREHQEARWCDFDEARRLVVPRLAQILAWAEKIVLV